MKRFNLIFCVLFFICAALQYNDPDPYIWIPVYLYGAVLCWLAWRKKYYTRLYMLGMVVFAVFAIHIFFKNDGVMDWLTLYDAENIFQDMKASRPWIEATREFLGLLILIIVLTVNYINAPTKKTTDYY